MERLVNGQKVIVKKLEDVTEELTHDPDDLESLVLVLFKKYPWLRGFLQGVAGRDGADGAEGPPGPQGEPGEQGPVGEAGPAGVDGAEGPAGPAGADGAKGDKGDKGDTGDAGADGAKGDTGDTGPTGPAGPGVPTGGTAGQVLAKVDATSYNTEWVTPSAGSSYQGYLATVTGWSGGLTMSADRRYQTGALTFDSNDKLLKGMWVAFVHPDGSSYETGIVARLESISSGTTWNMTFYLMTVANDYGSVSNLQYGYRVVPTSAPQTIDRFQTESSFTVPALDSSATLWLECVPYATRWMVGRYIWIKGHGYFEVTGAYQRSLNVKNIGRGSIAGTNIPVPTLVVMDVPLPEESGGGGGGGYEVHGAIIYKNATQSLGSANVIVTLGGVSYDTESSAITSTADRLIVPAGYSWARVGFGLQGPTASGQLWAGVYKSGASEWVGRPQQDTDTEGADFVTGMSPIIPVVEGDYFQLVATGVGTSRTLAATQNTWLSIELFN